MQELRDDAFVGIGDNGVSRSHPIDDRHTRLCDRSLSHYRGLEYCSKLSLPKVVPAPQVRSS